jgi:hypothetical protein
MQWGSLLSDIFRQSRIWNYSLIVVVVDVIMIDLLKLVIFHSSTRIQMIDVLFPFVGWIIIRFPPYSTTKSTKSAPLSILPQRTLLNYTLWSNLSSPSGGLDPKQLPIFDSLTRASKISKCFLLRIHWISSNRSNLSTFGGLSHEVQTLVPSILIFVAWFSLGLVSIRISAWA